MHVIGSSVLSSAIFELPLAVVIIPDGKIAVSGSSDKTLNLWDFSTDKAIASFIGNSPILYLAISPFGRMVFAGENSGYVHFLQLEGV